MTRSHFPMLWLAAHGLLAACSRGEDHSDSVRAASAHEDSVRRFGALAWNDDEVLAYMRIVSITLAADSRLVNRRSHSGAVRALGQQVTRHQREIGRLVDSALAGRSAMLPPVLNMEALRSHEAEMRRLVVAATFDSAYVDRMRATLAAVLAQLEGVEPERQQAAVGELVTKNRMAVRTHLGKVTQLQAAFRTAGRR